MYRKLFNTSTLSILVMLISAINYIPSMCSLYPDLSTEYGRFQQYQDQPTTIFTGPTQVQQPELLEQLPPLQILLSSGTPNDLARALTAIRAQAVYLDMQDYLGQTALHVAAHYGHTEIVQELLAAGADTQIRDRFNRTALDYAQQSNHHALVALLQPQVPQLIQNTTQNTQEQRQESTRPNTGTRINFKEVLLWGCTTGALALLAYKLAQDNTRTENARY